MPNNIDTRNLDATAGAVFFAVGRGTEGGGSSYHLSIAGITKGLDEPKWGTVSAVAANSGYSLGTIQVDFGQRGTWPLGATAERTLKAGETTYVDAVIDQASAYAKAHRLPFTNDRADLRADLLSHGDGEGKRSSIRFIDVPTRDSINAWAGSPEGKQWIHTHVDYPQVRNATHIAMTMLDKHGSGIAEDKRFEAIALIAKSANQLPGTLPQLEAVLKRGGDYQDLRDKAAEIRQDKKYYAGLAAADVAAGYEDGYARHPAEMDRAHLKVGRRDFAPANEGSDPDIRVALEQARSHRHGAGGPQVLKEGSSGRAVEKLEHNLHALGYGGAGAQAIHPDRQFDAATRQAVEAFQRDHRLTPVDGKAGPATLGAIDREARALQGDMAALGLTDAHGKAITADGYLGAGSQHAINVFQQQHHLPATGMADAQTRRMIDAEAAQHRPAAAQPAVPAASAATTPAPERHAAPAAPAGPAAPGGARISVVEPFGNGQSNRVLRHGISGEDAFRELKIHHPNTNAAAVRAGDASRVDRTADMVEGELEAVRKRGDTNGIPLVQKDLILTDPSGRRALMIPSPVAGYVKLNNDGTNSISIYSHPVGDARRELVGQVLHGERGSIPYKTGDFVEYGAPLVRQSDVGSPGAVHAHIEVEPAQFRKYLGDMLNDRITLGGKVQAQGPEAAQAARATSQAPMADGMLVKGERGDEVKALQGKLAALGHVGADGKPLAADGIYGKDTVAAVKQFQANNGLDDDGKAGRLTLAKVNDPAAVKAGGHSAAPVVPARAESAATAALPSMRDPSHAEHGRFEQALEKLQVLQQQRVQAGLCPLFANAQDTERAAGQLAYESKVAGMRQIDHVVARPDGSGLFAVQGNVGDPAAQRTFVDSRQAVSQSVEASTRQTEELDTQFNQRVQEQQQEQVKGRAQ